MSERDRQFLARAEAVSENYKQRIQKLRDRYHKVMESVLCSNSVDAITEALTMANRLDALQTEAEQHAARVAKLQDQERKRKALLRLCAEANKLAGRDGLTFWQTASRVF